MINPLFVENHYLMNTLEVSEQQLSKHGRARQRAPRKRHVARLKREGSKEAGKKLDEEGRMTKSFSRHADYRKNAVAMFIGKS